MSEPRATHRSGIAWPLAIAAIAWAIMARQPLFPTDLWGHVAYGEWIAANGVPATEPLLPSCDGVPMPPLDWLWKLAAYRLATLGDGWLIWLQAAPVAAAFGFLAARWMACTRSALATVAASLATGWLWWEQLIIRPQLVGMALFAAAWWIASQATRPPVRMATLAALFAIWTQAHGSWPIGLAMLGLFALADRSPWRFADLAAAAAAVCLNPAGPRVFLDVLGLAANPGVYDLIEWQPLSATPRQLRATVCVTAALVGLVAATAYRRSPQSWGRLAVAFVLLGLTWRTSRWIVWLAPVLADAIADRIATLPRPNRPRVSTGLAAAVAAAALGFAITAPPLRPAGVPTAAIDSLNSLDRPTGDAPETIFNRQGFGDALLWFGPEWQRPLVHSHVHLIPGDVWRDYRLAVSQPADAPAILDRSGCRWVMLQRYRDGDLYDALRATGQWDLVHHDQAAVLLRRAGRTPPQGEAGPRESTLQNLPVE